MPPIKYYILSTLLFSFVLVVLLALKNNLSIFALLPIAIFIVAIGIIHYFNKYVKREKRMSYYRKKKIYNSYSDYLEKNDIGELSGLAVYECYSDYQDTKLFYDNGMITGNFKKKYAVSISELNTPKSISKHALEFSIFLLDEPEVHRMYLRTRFIEMACTYHYISMKRISSLENIEIADIPKDAHPEFHNINDSNADNSSICFKNKYASHLEISRDNRTNSKIKITRKPTGVSGTLHTFITSANLIKTEEYLLLSIKPTAHWVLSSKAEKLDEMFKQRDESTRFAIYKDSWEGQLSQVEEALSFIFRDIDYEVGGQYNV